MFQQTDGARWVAFLAALYCLFGLVDAATDAPYRAAWKVGMGGLLLLAALRQTLRVRVDGGELRARRGWGAELTVRLADVREARVRRWGEASAVGPWSHAGYDVVELTLADGATVQVGTSRARDLAAALGVPLGEEDMLPRLPPWTEAQVRRATALYVAGTAAAIALLAWWVARDLG